MPRAVTVGPDGRFAVDHRQIRTAVEGLTRRLLTIEAEGDYDAAHDLLETLGVIRPEVQSMLDRLTGIPIDIRPNYVTAAEVLGP